MTTLWSCTDSECMGDCTYCNRALAENPPLACDEKTLATRCAELTQDGIRKADEIRALRARVAELERKLHS